MTITKENGYINYSIDDMDENVIVIDLVEVFNKRQGTGSELVREVIAIAREEGKDVALCAYAQDDSIEQEDLVWFYRNLGFAVIYDCGEWGCDMIYRI